MTTEEVTRSVVKEKKKRASAISGGIFLISLGLYVLKESGTQRYVI